jgi:preprotein translocase subunit SecB
MEKETAQKGAQPQVLINAQYIKDLSFENPNAPECFTKIKNPPKIDLSLDVQANKVEGDSYEVCLKINAKALNDKETLFVIELDFAGLFSITNCSAEEQKEQILLIYCPSLIFPFARRVIADVSRDGGFQPLMVNPVDFAGLYLQQKDKKKDS